MAAFFSAKQNAEDFINEIFSSHRCAENYRELEFRAAIKIQSWYRGLAVRHYMRKLNSSAILIQKTWRGHVGRDLFRQNVEAALKRMLLDFYVSKAITIQKHWRGFYVRKYVHNFYLRKAYLEAVVQKNEIIREHLEEFHELRTAKLKELEQDDYEKNLKEQARKHHYLLSTVSIPGIYNSPLKGRPDDFELEIRKISFPITHRSFPPESPKEPLPELKKVKGPFKSPEKVYRQKTRKLEPTLRCETDFYHLQVAQDKLKQEDWISKISDKNFVPATQYRKDYVPNMWTKTQYDQKHEDSCIRKGDKRKFCSDEDFKTVVSPIPLFDKFNKTYTKGAALC